MTALNEQPGKRIAPERLAEAAVWISRLHSNDRTDADSGAVKQWLKADSMNAAAFEIATDVWEDSAKLRRIIPPASDDTQLYGKRLLASVVAMVAVTVVLAAVVIGVLLPHDRVVSTAIGEQRWVTLPDNTRLFLNTATRLIVRYDRHLRRVELKTGEALFDVTKRPDWPFIVQAGDQQVTALGTSFAVRRDSKQTVVTLVTGRVTVASDTEVRVPLRAEGSAEGAAADAVGVGMFTLRPGQRVTFAANRAPRMDSPRLEQAMAWIHGQVFFDDTPLSSAVADMNRYSSIKLVIEGPAVAHLLVSGLFQAGASASFAKAVADTYGLSAITESNQIVLSGEPRAPARPSRSATP